MNRMEVVKDGRALGSVTTLRDRTAAGRPRARARVVPQHDRAAAGAGARVRQPAAHDLGADPARRARRGGALRRLGERAPGPARPHAVDAGCATRPCAPSSWPRRRRRPSGASSCASATRPRSASSAPRDSADLATVVGNLVDNAIDATAAGAPDGGERWVAAAGAAGREHRRGHRLRLRARRGARGGDRGLRARLHDEGGPGRRAGDRPRADPAHVPAARR